MITCLQCVGRGSVAAFLQVQCRFLVGIPYHGNSVHIFYHWGHPSHPVQPVDMVGIFIAEHHYLVGSPSEIQMG